MVAVGKPKSEDSENLVDVKGFFQHQGFGGNESLKDVKEVYVHLTSIYIYIYSHTDRRTSTFDILRNIASWS